MSICDLKYDVHYKLCDSGFFFFFLLLLVFSIVLCSCAIGREPKHLKNDNYFHVNYLEGNMLEIY